MKRILVLILLLVVVSCSKKKPILGERKDVFITTSNIEVTGSTENIKISNPATFKNYYGSSSILNDVVENYRIDSLNIVGERVARKKIGVTRYYFSNPAVVDGVIYYLDTGGFLNAKDLKTNNRLWKTRMVEDRDIENYYIGKLTFHNNNIYLTIGINEIISVNSKDGLIHWRKKLNTIPNSVPVVENDTIFVSTQDNKLYAIDTDDGRIKWIHYGSIKDSGILGAANPVIYNNYIIAAYSSGELFIINKYTGESVYNTNLVGRYAIFSNFELTDIDSTPIIKDNILIATANNGITVAIDLNSFREIWKQNLPSLTNVLINDNFVYMVTTDNIILCLNLKDGRINWFKNLDQYLDVKKKKNLIYYKSLVFINSKLYAFNSVGQYKVINPMDGRILDDKLLPFVFFDTPFSIDNNFFGFGADGRSIEIINTKK